MHDDRISDSIKNAAETFEPPWLDVRTVVKRGRRRWWLTRPAVAATTLALAAGSTFAISRVDFDARDGGKRVLAAAALVEWQRVAAAPIEGRYATMSAWTGEELLVWGGLGGNGGKMLGDGASYDPATDEWAMLPEAPGPRMAGQQAVWTGSEMLVWGGEDSVGPLHDAPSTGLAFDPAADRWRSLPEAPHWSLAGHVAVWTGSEMLVWGGVPSGQAGAAAYDPAKDKWKRIPLGPLGSRHGAAAVWTGSEMIVWGGMSPDATPVVGPDAAAFDPGTRTWRTLPDAPFDPPMSSVIGWTGSEMIVAGGHSDEGVPTAGAAFDPVANQWREIADIPPAAGRDGAPIPLHDMRTTPVWTDDEMVFVTADGVLAYDPGEDVWRQAPAPLEARRTLATTVWTGDQLIVWSGSTWGDTTYSTDGWTGRE